MLTGGGGAGACSPLCDFVTDSYVNVIMTFYTLGKENI